VFPGELQQHKIRFVFESSRNVSAICHNVRQQHSDRRSFPLLAEKESPAGSVHKPFPFSAAKDFVEKPENLFFPHFIEQ
jgi:hypothetical protein